MSIICFLISIIDQHIPAVVVIDDLNSFAVFSYRRGELNWSNAYIGTGFSAIQCLYATNPFSRTSFVNNIESANQPLMSDYVSIVCV